MGQTTGNLEFDTPRATVPSLSTCDGHTTGRGVVQAMGQTMRHVLMQKSKVSFWSAKVHPKQIKLYTAGKVNWTKTELLSLKRSTIDKKLRDNATRRSTSEIATSHITNCRSAGGKMSRRPVTF